MSIYDTLANEIAPKPFTDKCIVLDLDQTLLATQDDMQTFKNLRILSDPKKLDLRERIYYMTIDDLERPGEGTKYDFWGLLRPHINKFLIFCFSYFSKVIIWSAGNKAYVDVLVQFIFQDLPKPHLVLTRDDIVINNHSDVIKPLEKIFKMNIGARPNNTFVVDDLDTTFSKNPDNAIHIPEYEPEDGIDLNNLDELLESYRKPDNCLRLLMLWLLKREVISAEDVRKLDKSKIFRK